MANLQTGNGPGAPSIIRLYHWRNIRPQTANSLLKTAPTSTRPRAAGGCKLNRREGGGERGRGRERDKLRSSSIVWVRRERLCPMGITRLVGRVAIHDRFQNPGFVSLSLLSSSSSLPPPPLSRSIRIFADTKRWLNYQWSNQALFARSIRDNDLSIFLKIVSFLVLS